MGVWVQDSQGVEVNVGVCAMGLLIFKDKLRTARYPWQKIIKIMYKRNRFTIKLRPPEVCFLLLQSK